mmetsp:Transcript_28809/g.67035  ORF Transcript_28809/g.67035 Transcript_28809/m.67035 type:complete len:417 (+) Transcript_28809:88-1338(+)
MARAGAPVSARENRSAHSYNSRGDTRESAFGTLGQLPPSVKGYGRRHSGNSLGSTPRGTPAAAALGVLGDVSDKGSVTGAIPEVNINRTIHSARGPVPRSQPMGKAEYEAMQKKKEYQIKHNRMLAQREADERVIRERCQKLETAREEKFQKLFEAVRSDDSERVRAGQIIEEHDTWLQGRRQDLHYAWQQEVAGHIERQVSHHLDASSRKSPRQLGFQPPAQQSAESSGPPLESPRVVLKRGNDPVKRRAHEQLAEEQFRRLADSVIGTPAASAEAARPHSLLDLSRPRNLLPVELWEQRKLCSSPFGYLAYNLDQGEGDKAFTGKRLGAGVHMPDEADGVSAAGKTKGAGNKYGILAGTMARDGQSSMMVNASEYLGASGAPCQDHFKFDRSRDAADSEFPKGKRTHYPNVPNR